MMADVHIKSDLDREVANLWLLASARKRDAHRMECNANAARDEASDIENMARRIEALGR
jgi:hypothetical protein